MIKSQFDITENYLRWSVDSNQNLTLYITNKDKTKVKTIEEFKNNEPGHDIEDILNPHKYYDEISKINKKYYSLKKHKLFKNEKYLNKLESNRKTEIYNLLSPVRKILKNDSIYNVGDTNTMPHDYLRLNWLNNSNYAIRFSVPGTTDSILKDNENIILFKPLENYSFEYKHFRSIEELKNYESELQKLYNKNLNDLEEERKEIQRKKYTEEILNF